MNITKIREARFITDNVKKLSFKEFKELYKDQLIYTRFPLKDREKLMKKDFEKITGTKIKGAQ